MTEEKMEGWEAEEEDSEEVPPGWEAEGRRGGGQRNSQSAKNNERVPGGGEYRRRERRQSVSRTGSSIAQSRIFYLELPRSVRRVADVHVRHVAALQPAVRGGHRRAAVGVVREAQRRVALVVREVPEATTLVLLRGPNRKQSDDIHASCMFETWVNCDQDTTDRQRSLVHLSSMSCLCCLCCMCCLRFLRCP